MYQVLKRLFDIVASLLALIVLSPLLLIAVIGIEVSDPGPVFYMAKRVGRNNKVFRMFKFRSMRVDKSANEKSFKADTSRIFAWGKIMRDTKLDELPQLINVFVGDMSLVGPRPEVRHYVDFWTPEQMHVLDVRPGITDPASIKFRNENDLLDKADNPEEYYINVIMQEKIRLYLEYVENHNLWYDIKLIFQTIKVVLTD